MNLGAEMSDFTFDQMLRDAAAGKTEHLAKWIEEKRSSAGIPYELIAALVRSSPGVKGKRVNVPVFCEIQYGTEINDQGVEELYIKKATGALGHSFKPVVGEVGRPNVKRRDEEILEKYEYHMQTVSKEIALDKLAKEYDLQPATINTIIANVRKRKSDRPKKK